MAFLRAYGAGLELVGAVLQTRMGQAAATVLEGSREALYAKLATSNAFTAAMSLRNVALTFLNADGQIPGDPCPGDIGVQTSRGIYSANDDWTAWSLLIQQWDGVEVRVGDGSRPLVFQGGVRLARETHAISHAYVDRPTVVIVGVTSTAAPRTITLPPAAAAAAGCVLVVKDESGGAAGNNITVDGDGAETIDGAATKVINTNFGALRLYCTGTAWFTW